MQGRKKVSLHIYGIQVARNNDDATVELYVPKTYTPGLSFKVAHFAA
jgi:hypothetical protein